MNRSYFLLVTTVILVQEVLTVDVKKLFHEKDLSELCKRRAIPSIFLGRHVVEASAFILHFAKLDLPYNCFISVRSESGSNMIMVINLPIENGLTQSCSENSPQFVVYELGETFGGYWGAIPEDLFKHDTTPLKFYTLKTTEAPTTKTETRSTSTPKSTTTETVPTMSTQHTEEMIEVEIPLLEVSGKMIPGDGVPAKPFDYEAAFDYKFDVTPIPGVKYDTSILPLVQLGVRMQPGWRREDGQEPRYDLDIMQGYTPDSRLTQPLFTPAISNKHRPNVNRRLQFRKNQNSRNKKLGHRKTSTRRSMFTKYVFPTTKPIKQPSKDIYKAPNPVSWKTIDELIEHLNKHKDHEVNEEVEYTNTSRIAKVISNVKHNKSIYLDPKLSIYDRLPLANNPRGRISTLMSSSTTTKMAITDQLMSAVNPSRNSVPTTRATDVTQGYESNDFILKIQTSYPVTKIDILDMADFETKVFKATQGQQMVTKQTLKEQSKKEKPTHKNPSYVRPSNSTTPPVSLVDHESWENIVKVAPGMAVFLNKSHNVDTRKVNKSDWSSFNETYRKAFKRKKRAIHSISIENGRPHRLTTMATTPTTTKKPFDVADMQEFARLVELQDDDMHGRVALRYLKQYVGPIIYNICGESNPYSRHVYLFNSSRIVLSLNNFTLSHMSLILTRARTLLNSEMHCPKSQLECQVSGARVCVDSLAACDGVPNCGSYDIYDEDRLMCGAALGLQRNVCLAALTVLCLLLTVFYGIHYWLKRCVPKVADAFFIYTHGVENILYLQSVMRSPGDDYNKPFYTSDYTEFNEEFGRESQKGLCSRIWNICFYCFKKKEKIIEDGSDQEILDIGNYKRTFSYMQAQLGHLGHPTVDTSVQTGDSLEMAPVKSLDSIRIKPRGYSFMEPTKSKQPPIMIRDSLLTLDEPLPEEELSVLKFFRESRSRSNDSLINHGRGSEELIRNIEFAASDNGGGEVEVSNTEYERQTKLKQVAAVAELKSSMLTVPSQTRRRIRFKEGSTKIPSDEALDNIEVVEEEEHADSSGHRKPPGHNKSGRPTHLSTIKEDEESNLKPRHFWEGKGKKLKKKMTR